MCLSRLSSHLTADRRAHTRMLGVIAKHFLWHRSQNCMCSNQSEPLPTRSTLDASLHVALEVQPGHEQSLCLPLRLLAHLAISGRSGPSPACVRGRNRYSDTEGRCCCLRQGVCAAYSIERGWQAEDGTTVRCDESGDNSEQETTVRRRNSPQTFGIGSRHMDCHDTCQ